MTRGLGDLLGLTEQRNFTFNLLPIYLGALPVLKLLKLPEVTLKLPVLKLIF